MRKTEYGSISHNKGAIIGDISGGATVIGTQNNYRETNDKILADLYSTNPRHDKTRIEETKGGILQDSYSWILKHPDFQQWRDDKQSRLLWIKGDPGKGKTMLLCGIINELGKLKAETDLLSYFFCQATDSRINNATAVLRGLIYMLIDQQPSLVSHIRKDYDRTGKALFKDENAWTALSEIFANILQDLSLNRTCLNRTYLIIDALDECIVDLPKLIGFIVQKSSGSPRIKWIVSSRNDINIERRLRLDDSGTRLSLELKENAEQISHAVNTYIDRCISQLPEIQDNKLLRDSVREKMQRKANGTFLWVSFVLQELENVVSSEEVLQVLDEVPMELKDVYRRMMEQIKGLKRQYPDLCRHVLSTVITAYRPLHLQELHILSGLSAQVQNVNQSTATIVKMCGSFLTIRDNNVYVVHQSAKDFLSEEASFDIFPLGREEAHYIVFSRSLQIMSRTLQRDMYRLEALDYPAKRVEVPDPDPLAASHYSYIYWVDHLYDWNSKPYADHRVDLQDGGVVNMFIGKKYLYWLEALSLCRSVPKGVQAMRELEAFIRGIPGASALFELVGDARRFVLYYRQIIEECPLQIYTSALLFSPNNSLIKKAFRAEKPKWVAIKTAIINNWPAYLQTFEGHSYSVYSVAFSPDGKQLASSSGDNTIKLWDTTTASLQQTLEGHLYSVRSVAFSPDGKQLASGSDDMTIKLWDTAITSPQQTIEGHSDSVRSVAFSPDGKQLETESGYINLQGDKTNVTSLRPQHLYSIFVKMDWILRDTERVLWLPHEYRAVCSNMQNDKMVLGHTSGQITLLKFDFSTLN